MAKAEIKVIKDHPKRLSAIAYERTAGRLVDAGWYDASSDSPGAAPESSYDRVAVNQPHPDERHLLSEDVIVSFQGDPVEEGDSFTLSVEYGEVDDTTETLPVDAKARKVEAALKELFGRNLGYTRLAVSGDAGGPYTVTVPDGAVVTGSGLFSGSTSVDVSSPSSS